jgi:mono/diheme cytochrome c family protein
MTSPRRTGLRRFSVVGVIGIAALAAGCGGGGEGDIANGKNVFQACSGCHALSDAGSEANVGPNLDDAFRAARQQGFKESQFQGVVLRWIKEAQPPMARDIVTGQDARDVAAYIASVAGRDEASAPRKASAVPPESTKVEFVVD